MIVRELSFDLSTPAERMSVAIVLGADGVTQITVNAADVVDFILRQLAKQYPGKDIQTLHGRKLPRAVDTPDQ